MQWILQDFEDTKKLSEALDNLEVSYTWHKVIPFVGELVPEPIVYDPDHIVMFGSYTLWRYAKKHNLKPGVFKIRPFVREKLWHPFLLNGADALFMKLSEVPERLIDDGKDWFLRPVDDSKEEPGNVKSTGEIIKLAQKVLSLDIEEIPLGALRHDTKLMLTKPVHILCEWRVWIVNEKIVTYSLYKQGSRVVYRHEIDNDALEFAQKMVEVNPNYSKAYVIDICRTAKELKIIETNCINAAGFYAADVVKLAKAINQLE